MADPGTVIPPDYGDTTPARYGFQVRDRVSFLEEIVQDASDLVTARSNTFTEPQYIDHAGNGSTLTLTRDSTTNSNGLVMRNKDPGGGRIGLTVRTFDDLLDMLRFQGHDEELIGGGPSTRPPQAVLYTLRDTPRLSDANMMEARQLWTAREDHAGVTTYASEAAHETHDTDGLLWTDKTGLTVRRSPGDAVNEISALLRSRLSSVGSNYFMRTLDAASTAGPVVRIVQGHAGDDQIALIVQQSGSAAVLTLEHTTAGQAFNSLGGYFQATVMAAKPSAPGAGKARWYFRTIAGKVAFCVRMGVGDEQVIQTEL